MARIFLITPFSPERAGNEAPDVFARVQDAVREAAKISGVHLVHPAEIQKPGAIMDQVNQELDLADIVIAILTGENPNVFYELGRTRSPAILVVDSERSV